ncbi:TPA: phage tail spike protein [Streptococcus suis]
MISLKDKNVLLVNAFDDDIEQEGNGKYQLSFKYPTSDQRWKNIELADLLLADDLHGEQEFRVFEIARRNGYIFVYANQVVDDLNSYSINNISVDRVNGQTAMQALAGSIVRKHPFVFYSDIQDRHIFNQKNISVMDALANGKHSIVGQWGGDLVRDKYNVNLLKRGGRESEALFMYKKNLKSYTETNSIKGLFTRLNLSIKDSDIKTTVDSPLIDSYGGRIYELNIEVTDQDVTTLERLQEYGRNYFAEKLIDVPNNSLTISVTDNQEYDVRIFDMVFVHHEIFDKDLRMKITSYRFSPMGRKLKSVGFGKIKANLNQQVSNIATEVAEQSVSVVGEVFEEKLQKEIENADKVIDGKINKVRDEINDGIEQAQAEAERYADTIKKEITTEINDLDTAMQAQSEEHDRQVADILSKTQSIESLANQAKSDAASAIARANQVKTEAIADAREQVATVSQALNTAKSELQTAIANADQKARDSQASATALRNDLNLQANKILAQAQAQTALTNRVTTVETMADGTRSTVAELSKTVNKATGDITSVTNRTKVVEDGLVGVKNSYGTISQKVNTQTGQITSINQRTAQLESGLNGVKEKFENIKIGSKNYFSQYLANYDTSGTYAIRLVSETQPITITVTDKDTSVDVSGCYFGLFKDKAAEQGAQWFLSNGTLNNDKKTISGWPILAVYPKNQATLDKLSNRYKIMVEIGNIATDWVLAEEDFRHELATYVRNAEEDSAELSRRIESADDKAVDAKAYAQQTAEGFKSRIESLESYKNAEGTRAEQYLSASRTETAKQLTAERAIIANNYLAKSVYDEDARGNTLKLNEIKTIADTAKQSLATYQNTVDRKLTELTSTTQTLDGKINTANTKVDTVAGQIRTELSKVEGKIPTIIGSRNYFSQYLANYDTSGIYAIRLVSETQPITVTVTDKDTSVNVSGCYFGLFKDKAAEQGAQWFLSNGTLNNAKKTISGWPILAVYPKNQATLDKIFSRYKVMVEIGNIATDWVPAEEDLATVTALHNVSDTVDSHTRTIGAVGETGSILDNVSRVTQTANGLVQEVSGTNGLKTQVSQLNNSYAIKNLTSAGTVLNQINLLANGTNRIDGRLTHITGQTLIDNGVIKNAMIGELDAGKITSGTVDAARIKANSIDGSKIAFDEAFFNGLSANQAYLKKLFAKNAFITSVQAVTLSASQITGGLMRATNRAMEVNLNAGQILYYTDQAALKRVLNGYPTQFVKFATGTVTGKGNAGVTVIGSNRWNSESSNDGGFVGIRAWNGANIDQIDVVGDTVRLASSAFEAADGWNINTLPGKLDIDAFNAEHRASSKIKVGDLWLWKNATTYSSMRDTINLIIDNLQLLHNNKSTERGYSYTLPAKV